MEEPEKPTNETEKPAEPTPQPAESDNKIPASNKPGFKERLKSIGQTYLHKKPITIPVTILVLLGALFAVPFTRYLILGQFMSAQYHVLVEDASTQKPVTEASVKIGDVSGKTDINGRLNLKVKVGPAKLEVTKKYYKTSTTDILVGLSDKKRTSSLKLLATGRQVPVTVVNKVSGKPVGGVVLTAAGADTKTDKQGKATLVLPADQKTTEVKIKHDGFNDVSGTIVVTEQEDKANTFAITPSGKIYFLSKLTGKIDVVKTNLDGSERQTVLAGTGKEDDRDTVLLASRDWKYLALKSKRDGGANPKLFLIDTASGDKVTTMDEGNATFNLIGWSDHRFVYVVNRNGYQSWQPKAQALKSYDATAGKIALLDETSAEGTGQYDYANSSYGSISLINSEVVFNKNWSSNYYAYGKLNGKSVPLISVKADGTARKTIKEFPVPANQSYYSIESKLYKPNELYLRVPAPDPNAKPAFYEYEDGKIVAKNDVTDEGFFREYSTYLESPSGKQTYWALNRDGKYTHFVGDASGENEKEVLTLSEHFTYGWYSDDYLLVSKDGSELSIMPVEGGAPLKISNYHKPATTIYGYGKGYGGL